MRKPVVKAPPTFRKAKQPQQRFVEWGLRLYFAGSTLKSDGAFRNLERLCEEHLAVHYGIEIVDLGKNPQLAYDDLSSGRPTIVQKIIFSKRADIPRRASSGRRENPL
jgi:hypothetical protein